MFTVVDTLMLQWADPEHKQLFGKVITKEYGPAEILIREDYDLEWGRAYWVEAMNGAHGAIQEYAPPTEPAPDEISRRQFFQYLAVIGIISKDEALSAMQGGVIPAPLQAIIDQLPTEDDKFNARMFVVGAQNFNRLHWLTDVVRQAMQWTVEQRDEFWREAAKL
ncbi:hypothetical protein [Brucella intermedia]|uniref:hypothetical protein n=1 Tax=Brucella intermedia TaxID=94625 RepID=UPI0023611276|nr:hypothetical protein [Brucella intermedia]